MGGCYGTSELDKVAEILLDGKMHMVRFEDGMTGIGSRKFWIDDKEYLYNAVRQSADLKKGNHFLYLIKWRDAPWDKIYIFIHESEVHNLFTKGREWMNPVKITIK